MNNQQNGLWNRFFNWLASSLLLQGVFALLAVGLVVAIAYGVENWRGKRAWQECKLQLIKNGDPIGIAALAPAPVPDEENVFAAPKMKDWFVGRGNTGLNQLLRHPDVESQPLTVATLTVVSSRDPESIKLDDSGAAKRIKEAILANLGPRLKGPRNYNYLTKAASDLKPVSVVVQADHAVRIEDVLNFFPVGFASSKEDDADFWLCSDAPNTFKLLLGKPAFAEDYLKKTASFEATYTAIRDALKRPHANLPGDYSSAATFPTANFVSVRSLAQSLIERADCHLLLNQPELALQDLTLARESFRLTKTGGKPMNLVSAMIQSAVCQIYVLTVAEGFRMKAWNPEQLKTLQAQLKTIQVGDDVHESMKMDRAGCCSLLESIHGTGLQNPFVSSESKQALLLKFVPTGWYYQNMATYARLMQIPLDAYSEESHSFAPAVLSKFNTDLQVPDFRPYFVFSKMCAPNCARAYETCANTQALVNEALIACALERYRHAEKHYPKSLDELMPAYIDSIPNDPVHGKPLHYKSSDGNHFALYSIGWDAVDNAGSPEKDWVWQ